VIGAEVSKGKGGPLHSARKDEGKKNTSKAEPVEPAVSSYQLPKRANRGTPSADLDQFVVIGGGPAKDKNGRIIRKYSDEEDSVVAAPPTTKQSRQENGILFVEISRSMLKYTEPEHASEDMLASALKVMTYSHLLNACRY